MIGTSERPSSAGTAALAASGLEKITPERLAQLERTRSAARLELETLQDRVRAGMLGQLAGGTQSLGDFEAARRSRLKPNRMALMRGGSADSHRDRATKHELRKQCQSLLRNDKLPRSMIRRLKQFVVGDSIQYQCRCEDQAFAKAAEKFISAWMDSCEHAGQDLPGGRRGGRGMVELCNCSIHSAMQDGDSILVATSAGNLQFIEAERIVSPNGTAFAGPTATMVDGVEYDATGRVVAFHVCDWAPGQAQAALKTRRLPAGSVFHMPCPTDDQANLTRPEPGLSAVIDDFERLRQYSKSVNIAALMATYFGLVIQSTYPGDLAGNLPGGDVNLTKNDSDGNSYTQKQAELEAGFILPLEPGEDAKQIDPKQPTQVYSDYMVTNLAMIGAEGGMPLVLWLLDFRQVNFHSARSAVLLMGVIASVWRRWLRKRLIEPAVRWRLARAIQAGEIEGYTLLNVPDGWDQADFIFPQMPVVDPSDQYKAEAFAVQNRLKTHREVVRLTSSFGGDYDEFLDQVQEEQNQMRERDIQPVYMPGSAVPGSNSATSTAPPDQGDPNAPAEDPNANNDNPPASE